MEKNETRKLVNFPKGKRPAGYKWMFIVKYKADESIGTYKARLVAKEHTQTL